MEKDFEAARKVSERLNQVLTSFYKNVFTTRFDLDVDFSNISSSTLKDFVLYAAGFIGFKNNEELEEMLTSEEIKKMLAGKFIIKYLNDDQTEIIAKKNGVIFSESDEPQTIKLYSIQDGTYYINKNVYDATSQEKRNFISLVTNPVELHTDSKQTYFDPKVVFHMLRNTFAHENPYINGNKLTFINFSTDDEIVVSKMWLRGYTEMFARKSMPFTTTEMQQKLSQALQISNNSLSSAAEIDSALDSVKHLFSEEQQQKFYTYKYLMKERILSDTSFAKKDLNGKIETIIGVTFTNPGMFETNKNSFSSQILYTLENMVGAELEKRKEEAPLDESDPEVIEFAKILEEISSLQKGLKIIQGLKSMQGKNGRAYKRNAERIQYLTQKANSQITLINPKKKLETAHMDLLSYSSLENLPVEVAVNVVYLMAFNNLVSSGFYEQLLRYSDFRELSPAQKNFFRTFDFGNIGYSQKKTGTKVFSSEYDASNKAFLLYSMRNALCHGNLTYSIPKHRDNIDVTYKNIILHFNAEKQGISIKGRLKDFYDLLDNPAFTQERPEEIVTTFDSKRIKEAEARRKGKQLKLSNNNDDDDYKK